ncbi:TMEM14-domain-containing protein [Gonapodya prolifera JEL478]|uniref:TMEM14-domain-containing protein n=1 Tax=Gonapodya prolifera (strain JEL478) TaxID=1344416 RepID=A0A139AP86_GONPJ|nr:TMEM14-domain-containing protein [Gonapodya prolifera JEL478]|eukprot:KXS18305.1 TMEM14-domain-containing protein [Gonapodya prolifera JEL478]
MTTVTGSAHPAFALSAITTAGGIIGYAKSGSRPSLIAGVSFGVLYGAAAYLINANKSGGVELATATSLLLTAAMAPRAVRSGGKAPVPTVLTGVGAGALWYYGGKYYGQVYGV